MQKRKRKGITDVRPNVVPKEPPDRNLSLESLLGIPSTKSTTLTSSQASSPKPQRNQLPRAARSEPRANQSRESTKTTLFPHGPQRTKSKSIKTSTKGSTRKATENKAEETPSPQPQKSTQSAPGTKTKSPESISPGQVNQQPGKLSTEAGHIKEEGNKDELRDEWTDATYGQGLNQRQL